MLSLEPLMNPMSDERGLEETKNSPIQVLYHPKTIKSSGFITFFVI